MFYPPQTTTQIYLVFILKMKAMFEFIFKDFLIAVSRYLNAFLSFITYIERVFFKKIDGISNDVRNPVSQSSSCKAAWRRRSTNGCRATQTNGNRYISWKYNITPLDGYLMRKDTSNLGIKYTELNQLKWGLFILMLRKVKLWSSNAFWK